MEAATEGALAFGSVDTDAATHSVLLKANLDKTDMMKQFVSSQLEMARKLQDDVVRQQKELQGSLHKMSAESKSGCGTLGMLPCKAVELAGNSCNFARMGAEFAYQNVNRIANAFGRVISLMCGCLMVGNSAACALEAVPEVCVFPYQGYGAVYAMSTELWETVKSTTSRCKVVGHPMVASKR